jgi:predicted ATP-dependent protease
VTNQIGVFNLANNIIGYDSQATAEVTNKYSPELVPGSGKVLFIEKLDQISRTNTASETIKFIFEF